MGATGRGTHEHHGVMDRVDIITGTLGKALGGAMGGFTAARREVIDMLRQKSRPYLFSNSLAPTIAGTSLEVLRRLSASTELRDRLHANTTYFRSAISELGFTIKPGTHPVVPVMLFDAPLASEILQSPLRAGCAGHRIFLPCGYRSDKPACASSFRRRTAANKLDAALAALLPRQDANWVCWEITENKMERILVIGANGQIGSELVEALAEKNGPENVIAADIAARSLVGARNYETLDVLDSQRLMQVIDDHDISQVYQLAALLSVTGEQAPLRAWTLNMNGLLNISRNGSTADRRRKASARFLALVNCRVRSAHPLPSIRRNWR